VLLLAILCETGKNKIIITELGNLVIKTFKPFNLLGRRKHCTTFRALQNKKVKVTFLSLALRDGLAEYCFMCGSCDTVTNMLQPGPECCRSFNHKQQFCSPHTVLLFYEPLRGVERSSCEDRLRELELFSSEKRKLQGDLRAAFQYLKDGDRVFSRACCNRTRGNGFKLNEG